MSITIWGLLAKSATDSEKIEEAIVRLIAAHNDDETAHLEVGQSLQSHKAAEIIDHLALSIIADKLADKSVGIDKLSWDKFIFESNFQSIDGFQTEIVGAGSAIDTKIAECVLSPGSVANAKVVLRALWDDFTVAAEQNPFFQVLAKIHSDALDNCNVALICGDSDPFGAAGGGTHRFGFKYDYTVHKMYAFYHSNTTEYKTEITGYSWDDAHIYRAELEYISSGHDNLKFYIDTVLVHTYSNVDCTVDSNYPIACGIKDVEGAGGLPLTLSRLIFAENSY